MFKIKNRNTVLQMSIFIVLIFSSCSSIKEASHDDFIGKWKMEKYDNMDVTVDEILNSLKLYDKYKKNKLGDVDKNKRFGFDGVNIFIELFDNEKYLAILKKNGKVISISKTWVFYKDGQIGIFDNKNDKYAQTVMFIQNNWGEDEQLCFQFSSEDFQRICFNKMESK